MACFDRISNNPRGVAWCLFFLASISRLLFCFLLYPRFLQGISTVGNSFFVDSYLEIAQQLLLGNGYRTTPDGMAILHRPPGYVLIALLSLPLSDFSASMMFILHSIVGGLAAVFTFYAARSLLQDVRQAAASGLIIAFWPFLIWESKVSVPENLLVALVPAAMIFLLRFFRDYLSSAGAVVAGLLIGYICLCHGMYQFFLVCFTGAMFLKRNKKARDYRAIVILLSVAILVVVPWTVRNYSLANRYIGTATGFGLHYLKGERNFELLLSGGDYWNNQDEEIHAQLMAEAQERGLFIPDETHLRSSPAVNEYFDQKAREHIKRHPWRQVTKAIIRFPLAWFQQQNLIKWILNIALMAPLLVMAVVTSWRRRKEPPFVALTVIWFSMNCIIAAIFPEAAPMRYVIPLLPLVAILACQNIRKVEGS
jgi:4-amino-4-deoxy-L-arabinose transferase-like glycosyltransferase